MHTEQLQEIERDLRAYEVELYNASVEYKSLARDAAEKRAAYDVAYAQEFLKITTGELKMTVPATEALAVKNVESLLTSCRIAEAMADGAKRHLATLQSVLTSVQTRASLLKTERSLVNMMS